MGRRGRVAGLAGAVGAVAGVLTARRLRPRRRPAILTKGPQLVAHRGGAGLAPENTLAAFRQAVDAWGADMIELDVHASADGHAVVIHDPTVDRTTDGTGRVSEMSLAELQRLDAGHRFTTDEGHSFPFRGRGVRIPTIGEVLAAVPDTPLIVEIKTGAAQAPLFDAVRRAGATHRVIAASESDADRDRFGEYDGPVAASKEQLKRFYLLHRIRLGRLAPPDAELASVPEVWEGRRVVTPRFVRDLGACGLAVQVWTVNDRADMERLLEWGVDGILTDYPDVLAAVLNRRFGRPLPPAARHGDEGAAME